MTKLSTQKQQEYNNISQIIKGKPATSMVSLPNIWQELSLSQSNSYLSDSARMDYVEAAQLFNYHKTPLAQEAMIAIGNDFDKNSYPDFSYLRDTAQTPVSKKTVSVLEGLFSEFGYDVPASFYNALIEIAEQGVWKDLFKNKDTLIQDRLWDSVLHAVLLVTPIGLYVHSVFSQNGLRFTHMMNCSCKIDETKDKPFYITLDQELKAAYLQNVIAASFEQYGVNASTSGKSRGF